MKNSVAFLGGIALLVGVAGCGSPEAPAQRAESTARAPVTLPLVGERAQRMAQLAAVQAGAGPAYAISRRGERFEAKHPSMLLRTSFEPNRVLVGRGDGAPLDLAMAASGCDGELVVTQTVSPLQDAARPNRIEYARGGVAEWYVHGPAGLEQGFTITELPACAHAGEKVVIRLAESPGWSAVVNRDSTRATLRGPDGQRLQYGELYAADARGKELPVRIARGSRLSLELDVAGAALPIVVDPLVWLEEQKLVAVDGLVGDEFGEAVSLSGDTALIGARADDDKASGAGVAHVFVRSGTTWSRQQKLTANDGTSLDNLGESVAVSGDLALAGAPGDASSIGAAYVFVRSGTTWTQEQRLTANDGAASDFFGSHVALDGSIALVSASGDDSNRGAVYAFVRSGTTWTQEQKLTANDGTTSQTFGVLPSLSGSIALVGAPNDQSATGAAYVFVRSGTTWTQERKLTASDAAAGAWFGFSPSVSGETAIVGAHNAGSDGQGMAYVFVRSGTTWTETQKLLNSDSENFDSFGFPIAVSGERAAIVATGAANNEGAIYVFARSGTSWTEQKKLTASDVDDNDEFALSVSMDGENALAGAYIHAGSIGAAYVFVTRADDGDPCAIDSDCLSNHCAENVCCDDACAGGCESCLEARKGSGSDGACGPIALGEDFKDACADEGANSCDETGVCDGAGACQLYAEGTECGPAYCPDASSANPADLCDGAGTCVVSNAVACEVGYSCASGACQSNCESNADCDSAQGFECFDGVCLLPTGSPCETGEDCEAGYCADGVCCDAACNGECEACAGSLTGMADGSCTPIPADQDPEEECEASDGYPLDCQADGACDGQGACRTEAKAGTPCGDTTCTDGVVQGQVCDGVGECSQGDVPCTPYVCDGTACGTNCATEADCDPNGGLCIEGNTCTLTKSNGEECTQDLECNSGFCVDGVCCENACESQCAACAEDGQEGECVAVEGAPRGEREPCADDGSECGGECNGEEESACEYPGAGRACGQACQDGEATMGSCDGQGACELGEPVACGSYACGAGTCLTTCGTDADCAEGLDCDAETGNCEEPGASSPPMTSPSFERDTGCGCRTVGRRGGAAGWLALVGAGVLARRRRKAAQSASSAPMS